MILHNNINIDIVEDTPSPSIAGVDNKCVRQSLTGPSLHRLSCRCFLLTVTTDKLMFNNWVGDDFQVHKLAVDLLTQKSPDSLARPIAKTFPQVTVARVELATLQTVLNVCLYKDAGACLRSLDRMQSRLRRQQAIRSLPQTSSFTLTSTRACRLWISPPHLQTCSSLQAHTQIATDDSDEYIQCNDIPRCIIVNDMPQFELEPVVCSEGTSPSACAYALADDKIGGCAVATKAGRNEKIPVSAELHIKLLVKVSIYIILFAKFSPAANSSCIFS